MQTVLLYVLLTTAMYYLGARAMITQGLWSHYPPRLDAFMSCAACSGTWYGFVVGFVGNATLGLPFLGLVGWWTFFLVGVGAMVWTPLVAAVHDRALRYLGGE